MTVFEGFIDFLYFLAIVCFESQISTDFAIFNSVSLFEYARPQMEQYKVINLYLNNDKTGQNYSLYVLKLSEKYKNKSGFYERYKDVKEWVKHIRKTTESL